ncbi:IgGFc-binding protein-like [Branchiostoma lanceolatum]|uniref:IgGFc-binding protein-like n=1 Tax=Branchiostoma lanceolatum TaxID=7740 RepID=UPI0034543247
MARVLLSMLVMVASFGCSQAARDNKGTEFILTFPENFQRDQNRPKLFIACPHPTGARVTITLPYNGDTDTVTVNHGRVEEVELRREAVELRDSEKSDGGGRAVHITSDVEIVVYGVFAELKSSDAYLALPTDVLGTEYYAACSSIARNRNQEGWDDMPSQFGVVGVHAGTTVTIVPSQAVEFDRRNYGAGQAFSVVLDRFETLQVQATEDLTGSKITATQPVAVLSGNTFAYCLPMGERQRGTGDHLVQMIPPVDTWGEEFVTVPLSRHRGGDLFRVVAARDNTQVDVTNENAKTLNAGEFWEIDIPSDEYRHVTTSEPVLLVQYSKTGSADNTATDPFMMIIPSVAQFEAEYTFSTVDLLYDPSRTTHHINVVTSSADIAGLRLDEQPLPSDTVWHDVPGTRYAAAQLTVSGGTHTVRHMSPIVTTGLFSYGFTYLESYGYPGGLRLAQIAAPCSTTAPVPADRVDNDCDGRVDEELLNGIDDDGDGLIDEDLAIGNCADHRRQYETCLLQRCRNMAP